MGEPFKSASVAHNAAKSNGGGNLAARNALCLALNQVIFHWGGCWPDWRWRCGIKPVMALVAMLLLGSAYGSF